jgi:hypothetical protein
VCKFGGDVKGRGDFGDIDIDGRITLKEILEKQHVKVWIEYKWLRLGCSGGLWCAFGLHTRVYPKVSGLSR